MDTGGLQAEPSCFKYFLFKNINQLITKTVFFIRTCLKEYYYYFYYHNKDFSPDPFCEDCSLLKGHCGLFPGGKAVDL